MDINEADRLDLPERHPYPSTPGPVAPVGGRAVVVAETWPSWLTSDRRFRNWLGDHDLTAVVMVSPPVVGRLDWLTGDTHDAELEATSRLEAARAELEGLGLDVETSRADDDVVASVASAIGDTDATPGSLVMVIRHGDDSEAWRQRRLPEQISERLGVEVEMLELHPRPTCRPTVAD